MKTDPNKTPTFNSSSAKTQSPRQDHSQDMSGVKDNAKPSGDSAKPHGDPLRDTLIGRKH